MLDLPALPPRIIPALLLHNGAFVKTTQFKRPVYIGDPINTINLFNKFEVDEIVVFDISCSHDGRKPDFELIEQLSSECWVPLSYGGGIRTLDDAKRILNSGVEKVVFESLLHLNIYELEKCIKSFGSSSVSVCLDVKKTIFGKFEVRTCRNSKKASASLDKILETINAIQVGEIIVNNISRDGMRTEYDYDLIRYISDKASCPVIALGGASCLQDFKKVIQSGASAAAAGSFFVYQNNNAESVLVHFPERRDIVNLFDEMPV